MNQSGEQVFDNNMVWNIMTSCGADLVLYFLDKATVLLVCKDVIVLKEQRRILYQFLS